MPCLFRNLDWPPWPTFHLAIPLILSLVTCLFWLNYFATCILVLTISYIGSCLFSCILPFLGHCCFRSFPFALVYHSVVHCPNLFITNYLMQTVRILKLSLVHNILFLLFKDLWISHKLAMSYSLFQNR